MGPEFVCVAGARDELHRRRTCMLRQTRPWALSRAGGRAGLEARAHRGEHRCHPAALDAGSLTGRQTRDRAPDRGTRRPRISSMCAYARLGAQSITAAPNSPYRWRSREERRAAPLDRGRCSATAEALVAVDPSSGEIARQRPLARVSGSGVVGDWRAEVIERWQRRGEGACTCFDALTAREDDGERFLQS